MNTRFWLSTSPEHWTPAITPVGQSPSAGVRLQSVRDDSPPVHDTDPMITGSGSRSEKLFFIDSCNPENIILLIGERKQANP